MIKTENENGAGSLSLSMQSDTADPNAEEGRTGQRVGKRVGQSAKSIHGVVSEKAIQEPNSISLINLEL